MIGLVFYNNNNIAMLLAIVLLIGYILDRELVNIYVYIIYLCAALSCMADLGGLCFLFELLPIGIFFLILIAS